jgi:Uma2 family endonuclease
MGDLAERRMTLAEFLVWDDGTDTRYEFAGGAPRAMAPASGRHGALQDNAAAVIRRHLDRAGPCTIVHQAGLLLAVQGDDRYYVPDLAVTCRPVGEAPFIDEPKLVVEIVSPSTGRMDKDNKVPDYCTLPSVDEIWLIDSRKPLVHVYQRISGQWIGHVPLKLGQSFKSQFLDNDIAVSQLYRNTGLETPPAAEDGT